MVVCSVEVLRRRGLWAILSVKIWVAFWGEWARRRRVCAGWDGVVGSGVEGVGLDMVVVVVFRAENGFRSGQPASILTTVSCCSFG